MVTCNSEGHCDECYYGDYDALLNVILTSVTALNVVAPPLSTNVAAPKSESC